MSNMYEPCLECLIRYNRRYSDWCKENCSYANGIKRLEDSVARLTQTIASVDKVNIPQQPEGSLEKHA